MYCRGTQIENPAIRQVQERRRILDFRGIDPNRDPPCYIAPTIRRHMPDNTWIWDKALFNVPTCDCGLNCEKPGPGDLKWPVLHSFACKTPKPVASVDCKRPEPCGCEKCYRVTVETRTVGKTVGFAIAVAVAIVILFILIRRR